MSVSFNRNIVQKGCCKLLTLNRHSIQQWLKTFETIIFDADGVIWKHEVPLDGAPETFNALRATGKKAFICTNHSAISALAIWEKAQEMGLLVAKNEVLSSSQAAARYLNEQKFQRKVYIIGGQGIADELNLVGIESLPQDDEKHSMTSMLDYVQNLKLDSKVGAIVVGMDKDFHVPKLTKAGCYLMDPGVCFIATNRDLAFPVTDECFTPSSGIMVAAVEAVAKRAPITCGKPNPYICSHLIRQGVIKPETTLMVGDNIQTDIQLGYNCGFQTLLVGTGVTSLADISQAQAKASKVPFLYQQIPDLFVPKLSDLLPFLSSRNSLIDQEFVHNVACDIELFVKKRLSSGVLLFPPVGNYRRYLIHQTCENYRHKYDLFTFSVGQGPQRRTVLCFRNQLIDPHGFETRKIQQQNQHQTVKNWRSTTRSSSANRKRVTELCKMGVKKHISETPLSKSNSVDLYRPPALRKNSSEEAAAESTNDQQPKAAAASTNTTATAAAAGTSTTSKSSPNREQQQQQLAAAAAATRRERRPDRAVYVPRARRSQTTPPTTTTTVAAPAAAATTTATSTTIETATVADITSPKADDTTNSNNSTGNGHQAAIKSKKSSKRREQRVKKIIEKPWEDPEASATLLVIDKQPSASALRETETQLNQGGAGHDASIGNCDKDKEIMSGNQQHKMSNKNGTKQLLSTALRIEDASSNSSASAEDATKCDNDVQELQRASKEMNRSNRRIMKQTFISDVLEIPDKIETKPKAQKVAAALPQPQKQELPPADSTTEDDEEDEDDWENMFDESGDCLDPKILQELTDSVGKCKIELPKMDYTVYHIKQSLLNEEEFPHVLEVSNFPVEFKTPDLLMLFSQYKGTGFDIKWVDDTHALAVFSSSRIAAEVLTMGHPFVKLKPLAEATLESRLKAKKAATSLQPYRQRPETCTALARRLVSGALGVKLPTAPEERENERRVLREAKERKLLAAKQRDEAWES